MKLIEILPNIYGVKVPLDGLTYYLKGNSIRNEQFYEIESDLFMVLPVGEWNLLGTITATEISFDASKIVESEKNCKRYLDYSNKEVSKRYFNNAEFSFRSALPKEIYFENPIELPSYKSNEEQLNKDWEEYLKHQQNITEKLLILQKL